MSWAVLNAEMVEVKKARIGADDRGFILGDGLFETLRTYNGTPFRLHDHFQRLFSSCAVFNLQPPWGEDELSGMVSALMEKNGLDSARVRITVTRGRHTGSMSLNHADPPTLLITAEPIPPATGERLEEGIKLKTADVRFSESNPVFRHKTLNRLPHLLARTRAEEDGCDEALILDEKGNVACASTGNVFAVQYGQLFTPPLTAPILPGVTRKVVLEIARRQGIQIREDFFSPIMIVGADEVFMTNSVQEIVPVVEVNQRPVGSGKPGPVASRLSELYQRLTQSPLPSEVPSHDHH
jgi:branched-chain amino acid aminotransferase